VLLGVEVIVGVEVMVLVGVRVVVGVLVGAGVLVAGPALKAEWVNNKKNKNPAIEAKKRLLGQVQNLKLENFDSRRGGECSKGMAQNKGLTGINHLKFL
jgi:hypothetical protein